MLKIQAGGSAKNCDGVSRRNFVQVGLAGMTAMSLPQVLKAKEIAAAAGKPKKDTAILMLWLDGGIGHMDTYDMKPEAPAEYRGLWMPVPTNMPGFGISPLFPLQAQMADKFSIIRSLHHNQGDHFTAGHCMLTGRAMGVSGANSAQKSPFVGSCAVKMTGPRRAGMPAYVSVPIAHSIGVVPGYFGGHYLGMEYDPFTTGGDPNAPNFKVQNIEVAGGLNLKRLEDRRSLTTTLDHMRRDLDKSGSLDAMDKFDQKAFDLVTGEAARKAFDIEREDPRIRDRYGRTHWGQCTLLARRLVEAGSTLVTVTLSGWDHHWDLWSSMNSVLPPVDMAVSALLEDLYQTGLIERVMVILCSDFSRTPRMNDGGNGGPPMSMGTPGRDHWGNAISVLVAGAGIKGGRIIGSTNAKGEVPKDRPLTPSDLHHTIFDILGVDRDIQFLNHSGRPVAALEPGEVIHELF